MTLPNTDIVSASRDGAIKLAVEKISDGKLVAVPTETVYGLAVDATNADAVQHLYATKGRPDYNPLICHVTNSAMAERYVEVSSAAQKLMQHFWPGPLTLVMPLKDTANIANAVTASLNTLALRCPDNKATKAIIKQLKRPIAAPSANISGKISPTCATDVYEDMAGKIELIIDDGPTEVGIESTIVAVSDVSVTLLRPGSVLVDDVAEIAGLPVKDKNDAEITAPGQLKSHYAPSAKVMLDQTSAPDSGKSCFIGFGAIGGDMNLSASGDMREAAKNLFAYLRKADEGTDIIAVAPIPVEGIGLAINDRLKRAAAPRPTTESVI